MLDLDDPQLLQAILDNLQIGLYVSDRTGRIVFWNDGAERITGYMRHTVLGHICGDSHSPRQQRKICPFCGNLQSLEDTLQHGRVIDAQIYLEHKAGYMIPVHARAVPVRNRHGAVAGVLRIFEERQTLISGTRKHLATHGCLDALSGVPNHRFTQFHLQEGLLSFAEYHLPFGILCIAIAEIEDIRKRYGREATFSMLHMVAQTAVHVLGPNAFLGRWGDNEFIGILVNCDRAELEKLGSELQRIGSATRITWWDDEIHFQVLITKAMVRPGDTLETLLQRAERRFQEDPAATRGSCKPAVAGRDSQEG
jgi:PAS domain S-box-containing protein